MMLTMAANKAATHPGPLARVGFIYSVHEEVTMSGKKSEQTKDPIWDQHLRWLDLVSNECKSNQAKREREKRRKPE